MSGHSVPSAVIVQQGKTLDFIDGVTQRNETPEEYVRQEIAKSLVREYDYAKNEIAVELVLRIGTNKPRADLVVFQENDQHTQDRAKIIIECKSQKIKSSDRKDGVGQLHSYMSACPNVLYGMWTNGLERFCYKRVVKEGTIAFDEIPDIPSKGKNEDDVERPKFEQLKAASSDALLVHLRYSPDSDRI
jgi:type I restriction enzyme M protein